MGGGSGRILLSLFSVFIYSVFISGFGMIWDSIRTVYLVICGGFVKFAYEKVSGMLNMRGCGLLKY